MGTYYSFVNLTKRQYFSIGALDGGDIELAGVGRNLASRAFELLLVKGHGSWAGDCVAVVGDDIDGFFSDLCDVTEEAALLLWQVDGMTELGPIIDFRPHLLRLFCRLAKSRANLQLETDLIRLLGKPRYEAAATTSPE